MSFVVKFFSFCNSNFNFDFAFDKIHFIVGDGEKYQALPFFAGASDDSLRYDVSADPAAKKENVGAFPMAAIRRTFGIGSDSWQAGDLTFTLYTPHPAVPDPEKRKAIMKDVEQILQDSGILIQPYWRSLFTHSVAAVKDNPAHPNLEQHFEKVWLDR